MSDPTKALRAVLEAAYLRAILHGTGRAPEALDVSERAAVLAPMESAITHDLKAIMAIVAHERGAVEAQLRRSLHDAPGVDHEMVDQALEYALQPRGGWRPQ